VRFGIRRSKQILGLLSESNADTYAGGLRDIVRHGDNGLLVPAADIAALATAIKELLLTPAKLREMSANSRRIAVKEYSLETQARNYLQLYQQLVPNTAS
jgi:glycosyltransferase involved in cell wall biosynthesis